LLEELPLSQASALAAKITGIRKKPLYQFGLSLNQGKK
jgi:16S rRNA (cytidine1402-2'-O)-methyltransferase